MRWISSGLLFGFGCGRADDEQEPDSTEEPSEQQENQDDNQNDHQNDDH